MVVLGIRGSDSGVQGKGPKVKVEGCKMWDGGLKVLGLRFSVQGLGLRV